MTTKGDKCTIYLFLFYSIKKNGNTKIVIYLITYALQYVTTAKYSYLKKSYSHQGRG